MLRGARGYSALALHRGTANKRTPSARTLAPSPSLRSAASPPCPWLQSARLSSLAREPAAVPSSLPYPQTTPPDTELQNCNIPRPATVEWHKDLANSVSLIGTVFRDFELKYIDTGKYVASSALRVTRQDKEDMWFRLQFWGDLAQVAATYVKKLDCIYVSGVVYVEKFTAGDNTEKTLCKVVGKDLKFVRQATGGISETFAATAVPKTIEDMWKDLFDNPSQWWDNRVQKINPRAPDYKHKINGNGLWIESFKTPAWVKERLSVGAVPVPLGYGMEEQSIRGEVLWGVQAINEGTLDIEKGWQDYFRNPLDWWDNRDQKKKQSSPDFKHKTSGQALSIVSSKNPAWVKSQLAAKEEGRKPGLSSLLNETDKSMSCMEEENSLFF